MGQLDRTSPAAHVLQKGAIILGILTWMKNSIWSDNPDKGC